MSNNVVSIYQLQKFFTGKNSVFAPVFHLQIRAGEFVGIRGPNGCGKSTLLHLCVGLDRPDAGTIVTEHQIRRGYVFQNYREALFPWRNVMDNLMYPLMLSGHSRSWAKEYIASLFQDFGLSIPFSAYPYELSGGQQQLINILRAYLYDPDVLCLDEAFASLDYHTTWLLYEFLQKIRIEKNKQKPFTVLMVSHSIDELITLSNRLVLLSSKPTYVRGDYVLLAPYPRNLDFVFSEEYTKAKRFLLS